MSDRPGWRHYRDVARGSLGGASGAPVTLEGHQATNKLTFSIEFLFFIVFYFSTEFFYIEFFFFSVFYYFICFRMIELFLFLFYFILFYLCLN